MLGGDRVYRPIFNKFCSVSDATPMNIRIYSTWIHIETLKNWYLSHNKTLRMFRSTQGNCNLWYAGLQSQAGILYSTITMAQIQKIFKKKHPETLFTNYKICVGLLSWQYIYIHMYIYITMASHKWHLNSAATRLFLQHFDEAYIKHAIRAPHHFMRGIHRWVVDFSQKGFVIRKLFPHHCVIMLFCYHYGQKCL